MERNAQNQKLIKSDFISLTLTSLMGKGSFCSVKRSIGTYIENDEKVPYAVKVYDRLRLKSMKCMIDFKLATQLEKALSEIKLAGMIDHPNIAKTFISFDDGERKIYCM